MASQLVRRNWWQVYNGHSVRKLLKLLKYAALLGLTALLTLLLSGFPVGVVAQNVPIPVPTISQPVPQRSFQEIRGVWLTTNDMDVMRDHQRLQEAVNQLARLNFNTIYVVVWNSGYVWYPSPVAQQAGIQPFVQRGFQGQDILADLVNIAHQRGLLVIPWFEFGFMAPPTSELTDAYPQWLTQKRDGSQTSISAAGEVSWLNPFHPEVQQLVSNLVLEVVSRYDVDGIQFDDHTALPVEFGYDSYTVNLYRQEKRQEAQQRAQQGTPQTPPPAQQAQPLDPPANPRDPAWMRWRADKITAFMMRLNQAVKARKPNAIFSVSPNPYIVAYNSFLQDWLGWVRLGIVDELVVQIYRPDLQSFVNEINRPEIQEVQQKIPTGAGVLTGLRNRPVAMPFIQSKVRAARDRGLGVAFFFYESLWDEAPESPAERQSGFQTLFPYPASRTAVSAWRSPEGSTPPYSTLEF